MNSLEQRYKFFFPFRQAPIDTLDEPPLFQRKPEDETHPHHTRTGMVIRARRGLSRRVLGSGQRIAPEPLAVDRTKLSAHIGDPAVVASGMSLSGHAV